MRFVSFCLFALLFVLKGESMPINPNELYDNLYDDFEKDMPIPLVACSTYASNGDFINAAAELYDFNKYFKEFFSSDFTKINSKESIEESLRTYCESVVDNYKRGEYSRGYPVKDFIWYSICGRLYFAYEGMISQMACNYESISKKNATVAAKEYILPTMQLLYKQIDHNVYQTFFDFCTQMLPCLMN